jgi:carbamoyl-phosphate synthase large subunit
MDSLLGMRIMVTGAGGPAGLAVIDDLQRHGAWVVAADCDPDAIGFFVADECVVVDRYDMPGYSEALCALAVSLHVAGLISTISEELIVLSANEHLFASTGIATWFPPEAALRTCVDKWEFAGQLHAARVATPLTSLGGRAEIPGPWVVKPRFGRGSRDVIIGDDSTFIDAAVRQVPDPVVQQQAMGREFTADCLIDRAGQVAGLCARWRSTTRGGISVKGTTFVSPAVDASVAATVRAVGLHGPINLQGFVSADGQVIVIEVNPRFSGALPLSIAAGAELVLEFVRAMFGESIRRERLMASPDVTMHRRFAEFYTRPDQPLVHRPFTSTTDGLDVAVTTAS